MKEDIKEFIMDTKDTAKRITSRVSKEANTHVTPFHLCLSIFMLLCVQMCSDVPTVRIILENNGSPVIVRNVETTKVIHQKPVVTKTGVIALISTANAASMPIKVEDSEGLQIGDCFINKSLYEDFTKNNALPIEDWEKETITYNKITAMGAIKFKYKLWHEEDKEWFGESVRNKRLWLGDYIEMRCPDAT